MTDYKKKIIIDDKILKSNWLSASLSSALTQCRSVKGQHESCLSNNNWTLLTITDVFTSIGFSNKSCL